MSKPKETLADAVLNLKTTLKKAVIEILNDIGIKTKGEKDEMSEM